MFSMQNYYKENRRVMWILRPDGVRPVTALLHLMLLTIGILASSIAWADSLATLAATPISVYFDSAPCIAAGVLCQSANGVDIAQLASTAANAVGPMSGPMMSAESALYAHDLRHWPSTGAAWSTVTAGLGQWGIPGTANVPGTVLATFHPIAGWTPANFSASAIGSISVGAMNLDTGMADPGFAYATSESLNVINVPEPSTWGMVLSGLALVGWITRRRMNSN